MTSYPKKSWYKGTTGGPRSLLQGRAKTWGLRPKPRSGAHRSGREAPPVAGRRPRNEEQHAPQPEVGVGFRATSPSREPPKVFFLSIVSMQTTSKLEPFEGVRAKDVTGCARTCCVPSLGCFKAHGHLSPAWNPTERRHVKGNLEPVS